jgi:hypothetical protein
MRSRFMSWREVLVPAEHSIMMALVLLLPALLVSTTATLPAASPPPDQLTLQDLVNHPERWPATVTLQKDYRLGGAVTLHKGDKEPVQNFDGREVTILINGDTLFNLSPAACGFLDAANAEWSKLTPAQRALDKQTIIADRSLWPEKVALTSTVQFNGGNRLDEGKEYDLSMIEPDQIDLQVPPNEQTYPLDYTNTDIMKRSRELAGMDAAQRPPRIANLLKGQLVDSSGKPVDAGELADKKLFLLYFGGKRCPRCVQTTPLLVSTMTDLQPKHPELQVILCGEDEQTPAMLQYMVDDKITWPALPMETRRHNRVYFFSYTKGGSLLPELVLVDRAGNVLADSDDHRGHFDPVDFIQKLPATVEKHNG